MLVEAQTRMEELHAASGCSRGGLCLQLNGLKGSMASLCPNCYPRSGGQRCRRCCSHPGAPPPHAVVVSGPLQRVAPAAVAAAHVAQNGPPPPALTAPQHTCGYPQAHPVRPGSCDVQARGLYLQVPGGGGGLCIVKWGSTLSCRVVGGTDRQAGVGGRASGTDRERGSCRVGVRSAGDGWGGQIKAGEGEGGGEGGYSV